MSLAPLAAAGLLGLAAVLGIVVTLLRRPWLSPWFVVPVFAVLPELQLRVSDSAGVLKDGVVVAVVGAALLRASRSGTAMHRLRSWGAPLGALAVVLALYVLNPRGSHSLDWVVSLRLMIEASGLLLAGLLTLHVERARDHLVRAVAAVAAIEAVFAWIQHAVGQDRLVYSWGYQFGAQVRETSGGGLRTSGTFAEPFALAAFGVTALALGLFVAQGRLATVLVVSSVAMIGATSVRTAIIQAGLLLLVWALHRGWRAQAAVATAAAVAAALLAGSLITTAAYPGGPEKPLLLGLNGRFDAWQQAVLGPESLVFGNGVAEVGYGSDRSANGLVTQAATYDAVTNPTSATVDPSVFLDSSYAQVQSDTGLVGTMALLAWLLGTGLLLVGAAHRAGAVNRRVSVGAFAVLLVAAVDGFGRTTLFAYPTGFLFLFVLGLLAADAPLRTRPTALRPSASTALDRVAPAGPA